ncbi:hypothetical protein WT97_07800 [Burkholderia sp. MSMB1459WGS]|uniref:LPD7 domain-containing protein n=1 Tax=Burkholderia sp. MSMB1459WGS TaxID=1637970 RepID=UPI00075FEABF|nr:LPD7 domain-containing protein [Burkholderia sp. MSMB1459WGS]KWO47956.1 hypothetical protein WT97_07800 [Burkholderia sp. MSMB1459WGS]
MDKAEWLARHETGPNPATNVIEPDFSLECVPGRSQVDLSGYTAIQMHHRQAFDASRAPLRKEAIGSHPRTGDRPDAGVAGIFGIFGRCGARPVPKLSPLAMPPEYVDRRYLRAGSGYFLKDAPDQRAFEDRGQYLVTEHIRADIVESMMDLARAKAWTRIRISGHEAFCQEVWLQATLLGMEVSGYAAKAVDLARLSDLTGQTEARRERTLEHLASAPESATAAPPRGVSTVHPEKPEDATMRQSTSDAHVMQLAAIVAAMREQGFSDRSIERVKQRATRMLDVFRAEGVELSRPRVFDRKAPSTRMGQTEQRQAHLRQREIEHAVAVPAAPER